jgi:serine/threonine protein kinase
VVADPTKPRPYYNLFFGTTAYASSEVLRERSYRAAPAEIWTLGVLLSYLLTGHTPFSTDDDAREGRVTIRGKLEKKLSRNAVGMMKMCLEPDPEKRATIQDVSKHRWLAGALDR